MAIGRPPKPTHLKILQGNPGRKPLPQNEPEPKRAERTPSVPTWLDDKAKGIWKEHARILWAAGLLTQIDREALAALCETTALYRTAVDMIRVEGAVWTSKETGYTQQSAWATVRGQALNKMQSLWSEFGMTPAARTRIQVEKPEKEEDDLAKLLKGRAGNG